jgi:hypothetical protein
MGIFSGLERARAGLERDSLNCVNFRKNSADQDFPFPFSRYAHCAFISSVVVAVELVAWVAAVTACEAGGKNTYR